MGMPKWDGHTHTSYCKHGHPDELERYLDRAVELGFERYSVTEHPPLPERWVDDEPLMRELAMDLSELPAYFQYVKTYKERYAGKLDVLVGLELDYLPGRQSFTLQFVEPWIGELEDVIVSVHYLPGKGGMRCVDYTPQDFATNLLSHYGSMEKVVDAYYDQVEEAIEFAGRLPIASKRIGHVNLIEKFRLALPPIDPEQIRERLERIVPKLSACGVGVDVNAAGLRVPTCGKAYVPEWFLRKCAASGIPCVYGSDAHRPDHVGTGWDWFQKLQEP